MSVSLIHACLFMHSELKWTTRIPILRKNARTTQSERAQSKIQLSLEIQFPPVASLWREILEIPTTRYPK